MRIEQVADLLGRGFGQSRGFRLQLAQLFQRDSDRLGESRPFRFDFALWDVAFGNRKIAALADMSRANRDPRRYPETRQFALTGAALACDAGDLLNPHRTCILSVWRALSPPPRL